MPSNRSANRTAVCTEAALALLLALSTVLAPAALAADGEIVLDNGAPSVQVSGAWTSAALTPGFQGADYLYRPASTGDATVFWPFPSNGARGRYEVSARWTSGPNRATNAQYWIASDAGRVPITRNQQSDGGTWQTLGSFDFQPGRSQGVTLSDKSDGVVIADALRWVGPLGGNAPAAPVPAPAPAPAPAAPAAPAPAAPAPAPAPLPPVDPNGPWTVALDSIDLHAGPSASTDVLATVPQFSYLQIQGYSGDWAYVFNPRARGTAYVPSNRIGPSDAPPAWVTAAPPESIARVEQVGRTVGEASAAFYPVNDKFAVTTRLGHNALITVHDKVRGLDGSTWYRVDQGYLPEGSVRVPKPPDRTFAGRWIDADLSEPAMLVAYEGDKAVLVTLAIKGRVASATPTGVFTINRRVEDETMDSSTLGVPVDSPEGYKLDHVLYTQYFTNDGASIHYNYWSSNFGFSGSHGCLGLDLPSSEFLWNWATTGTPVVIHT